MVYAVLISVLVFSALPLRAELVTTPAVLINAWPVDYIIADDGVYILYKNLTGTYVLTADGSLYETSIDEGGLVLLNGDAVLVALIGTDVTLFDLKKMVSLGTYSVPANDILALYTHRDTVSVVLKNTSTTPSTQYSLIVNITAGTALLADGNVTYGYGLYVESKGSEANVFDENLNYLYTLTLKYSYNFTLMYPINETTMGVAVFDMSSTNQIEYYSGIYYFNTATEKTEDICVFPYSKSSLDMFKHSGGVITYPATAIQGPTITEASVVSKVQMIPTTLTDSLVADTAYMITVGEKTIVATPSVTYMELEPGRVYVDDFQTIILPKHKENTFGGYESISKVEESVPTPNMSYIDNVQTSLTLSLVGTVVNATVEDVTDILKTRYAVVVTNGTTLSAVFYPNSEVAVALYDAFTYELYAVEDTDFNVTPIHNYLFVTYLVRENGYYLLSMDLPGLVDLGGGNFLFTTDMGLYIEFNGTTLVVSSTSIAKGEGLVGFLISAPIPPGKRVTEVLVDGEPALYIIKDGYVTVDPLSTIVIRFGQATALGGEAHPANIRYLSLSLLVVTALVAMIRLLRR